MEGTGGLVAALVAATFVTGCTAHTPPSAKPASTVTVSDPRGDTWEVRRQRQVPSTVTRNVDLAGPNDLCHPTARTQDRQGHVRIVYPAGSYCFPAERPAQVHVFRVETWYNGVQDDMFTSEPEHDRGAWVTLG